MRFFFKKKKINKVLRASLCMTLALACICAVPSAAFGGASDVGYRWTRIHTYSQLNEAFPTTNDNSADSDNYWRRILILDGDGNYYLGYHDSITSTDSDADKSRYLYMNKIGATTGIVAGSESFVTRSDLSTPFIKYAGYDDDYNSNSYNIRLASKIENGASKSAMRTDQLCINLAWYGINWHAAAYATFRTGKAGQTGNSSWERGAACNANIGENWVIQQGKTTYFKSEYLTEEQYNALTAVYCYLHGLTLTHMACQYSFDNDYFPGYYESEYEKTYEKQYSFSAALKKAKEEAHKGFQVDYWVGSGDHQYRVYHTGLELKQEAYDFSIFEKSADNPDKFYISESDYYRYEDDIVAYQKASSSVDRECCRIIFSSDKGSGIERTWNICSGGKVDVCKNNTGSKVEFMIYSGEAVAISIILENTVLNTYSSYRLDSYVINNSTQVTVPEGTTLVISGKCYNNGRIVVDGGVLVIQEYLDSDPEQSNGVFGAGTSESESYAPGDIVIKNGGTLIVESSGVLIHRNSNAAIIIESGGSARIDGVLLVANLLSLKDGASLRAGAGSFITIGVMPIETGTCETYTASYIKEHKSSYMSSIVEANTEGLETSTEKTELGRTTVGVYIGNGCSFDSQGGIYRYKDYPLACSSGGYFTGKVSTNIEANLESMFKYWSANY